MTMANSTVASPMRSSAASLRKTNKPLMEKRRRARINDSLSQLKSLVITGTKKDSSQFNKLEKADILELTVKHLRNLQNHQQQLQQQQQQQQLNSDATTMSPKYQDGFMECANEVIRYLNQTQGFTDDTKCRVVNHLANCIQLANTKATLAKQAAIQVQQIPSVPANNTSTVTSAVPTTAVPAPSIIGAPVAAAPGQIIQIVSAASMPQPSPVNGKPQQNTVQILPSPSAAATPVNISPAPASSSSSTNNAIPQQISIPNYAQPLHIQIPPAFSPVLLPNNINSKHLAQRQQHQHQHQQHNIQQRQYPQPMDITMNQATAPSVVQVNPNNVFAVNTAQVPSRNMAMATPDSIPSSPPQHPTTQESTARQQQIRIKQEAPIMHVHKIHGFYSSAEDFVPSRPRTFSATSSSSSSSSSSGALMSPVDSDITCPLNLSQSPCKPAESSVPKPRHFMDKNNKKRLVSNQYHSFNTNTSSPNSSDQENIPSNFNIMRSGEDSTSPLGMRKALPENPTLKYMTMMMEEDRHCGRDQGLRSRSTSPASSVGEDRSLWRPW